MVQMNWAPEHSDALRDHVRRGMTFSTIAAAINAKFNTAYSRNATIGRAVRMGLVPPARLRPPPLVRPLLKRFFGPGPSADRRAERIQPVPASETAQPITLRCAEVEPRHLLLVELEHGDCRYPYGGDREGEPISFCGLPCQPGSSYCTPHFHLSRDPRPPEQFTDPAWLSFLKTI